jgi:hypothetical protein
MKKCSLLDEKQERLKDLTFKNSLITGSFTVCGFAKKNLLFK